MTGKGDYSSKSIFIPAAGSGDKSYLRYPGSMGWYWSAIPDSGESSSARSLFIDGSGFIHRTDNRIGGRSVRPVR